MNLKTKVTIAVLLSASLAALVFIILNPPQSKPTTNAGSSSENKQSSDLSATDPTKIQPVGFVDKLNFGRDGYTSSSACMKCHESEFQTWHDSYHRTMTQFATKESVVPDFNHKLRSRGWEYTFEEKEGEFWVTMIDRTGNPNPPPEFAPETATPLKLKMLTGSHVAQTYWVDTSTGIQHVPWLYHIENKQWLPNEDSFLVPPVEHRNVSEWHGTCVKCHSTFPEPGYTETGFNTKVVELGIACESCHGPGQPHIEFHESKQSAANRVDPIVNPSKLSPDLSSQICAQCHSSYRENDVTDWLKNGSNFKPGEPIDDYVKMHHYGTELAEKEYATGHWHDGTSRTGGDEYLSMVKSKCFTDGELSCLSCHSMHQYESTTDQLTQSETPNDSCFNCHADYSKNIQAHTHHAADSSGSSCVNCHMPHTVYALFKGIRSHHIDSPNAAVTHETGRPNACNLCHVDKTLDWTSKKLTEWYSQPAVELTPLEKQSSNAVVMSLKGDAAQRVINAWHFSWQPAVEASGNDWQAAYLANLLDDPYTVVRYIALQGLKEKPGFKNFEFDFLAEPNQRKIARRRALDQWESFGKQNKRKPRPELFIGEDGQLIKAAATKVLKMRDESPIFIPE